MPDVVYFRGSRQQAREVMYQLVAMLAGRTADTHNLARGVFYAVGFSVLSDVKTDFIAKARGGTGADGRKWRPLSKEYLAYGRRFGPGEQAALKKQAGLGKAHRYAPGGNLGLLTAAQLRRWKQIFAAALARLRMSSDDSLRELKARAAMIAWAQLKREGAKTKLEVYGNRQVEIGRDTGILFNSLSPGELSGGAASMVYTKPSVDGGEQQVFQSLSNGIIVGTNVPYAGPFNKLRPFLPKGEEMPIAWQENMATTANVALLAAAKHLYAMGA
jgi:hypothetical protein